VGSEEEQEHLSWHSGMPGRLSRGGKERLGGQAMIGSWLGKSEDALGRVRGLPVGVGRAKGLR